MRGGEEIKKLKIGIGGALMILATLISDAWAVLLTYVAAAILHELGHLLAAWVLRIEICEIRLEFSGVRIVTDSHLISFGKEVGLAAAGPLVNIMSLTAVTAFCRARGIESGELLSATEGFLETGDGTALGIIGFFAASSLMHAAINLLPVKSFDGGRILEGILSLILSPALSERVVEITTLISSLLLWTIALYLMLKIASGLGVFVFAACVFTLCAQSRTCDGIGS